MTSTQEIDPELMETGMREMPRNNTGSLTDEQVAEYDREGYLVLPSLLSREDMAAVRESMSRKVSEIADKLMADGLISDKRENDSFETRWSIFSRA